jgi:hypothetical protein
MSSLPQNSALGRHQLRFEAKFPQVFKRDQCVIVPDALAQGVVREWRDRALELASQFAVSINRQSDGHVLSYRVVTGEVIRDGWPELWDFYQAASTREWASRITGEQVITSDHIRSAININVLERPGNVYRWHVDAVPHTLLLFLTDHEAEDGGVLEIAPGAAPGQNMEEFLAHTPKLSLLPRAGTAVLMDGTRCYHRATPILRPCLRLSVPMVYPVEGGERPAGLDEYLYGQR